MRPCLIYKRSSIFFKFGKNYFQYLKHNDMHGHKIIDVWANIYDYHTHTKWCHAMETLSTLLPLCEESTSHLCISLLTHWGQDEMAAILLTFLNAFRSVEKCMNFAKRFYWNLFLGFELTIFQQANNIPASQYSNKPLSIPMLTQLTDPYM